MVRSSNRAARGRKNARARRCPGGRRSCRWRTRKGAARRFMRVRSRAESKRPGVSCFRARFARLLGDSGFTRSATARPGSSAKSSSSSATGLLLIDFYHVCEYLAAASEAIAPDPAARTPGWRRRRRRSKADVSTPFCGRLPDVASRPKSTTSMRRANLPSLSQRSRQPPELPPSFGRRAADRLGRDRKRPSLRRPATPEAARRPGGVSSMPNICSPCG